MRNLILEEILKVVRGEVTPIAAADTVADWCEIEAQDAVAEEYKGYQEIMEDEEIRIASLQHASRTTGTPDMFSVEMRGFWNA